MKVAMCRHACTLTVQAAQAACASWPCAWHLSACIRRPALALNGVVMLSR